MEKKKRNWRIIQWIFLVLVVITFTPLVTPAGQHLPDLGGWPYTLWVGMIQAILMVLVTWLGTRFHPGSYD